MPSMTHTTDPFFVQQKRIEQFTPAQINEVMGKAWQYLDSTNKYPQKIIMSIFGITTGWCKEIYNYNFSCNDAAGFDSVCRGLRCYTHVVAWQWLSESTITTLKAGQYGNLVSIDCGPNTSKISETGLKRLVWFEPPHPLTKRPAYSSMFEGCIDFLYMVKRMYSLVWPELISDDFDNFVVALKKYRLTTDSHKNLFTKLSNASRRNKKSFIVDNSHIDEKELLFDLALVQSYKRSFEKLSTEKNK